MLQINNYNNKLIQLADQTTAECHEISTDTGTEHGTSTEEASGLLYCDRDGSWGLSPCNCDDDDDEMYEVQCCLLLHNLDSNIKGMTKADGVWAQGDEEPAILVVTPRL